MMKKKLFSIIDVYLGAIRFLLIANLIALLFVRCGCGMEGNKMCLLIITLYMKIPRLCWTGSGMESICSEWSKDWAFKSKELYFSIRTACKEFK